MGEIYEEEIFTEIHRGSSAGTTERNHAKICHEFLKIKSQRNFWSSSLRNTFYKNGGVFEIILARNLGNVSEQGELSEGIPRRAHEKVLISRYLEEMKKRKNEKEMQKSLKVYLKEFPKESLEKFLKTHRWRYFRKNPGGFKKNPWKIFWSFWVSPRNVICPNPWGNFYRNFCRKLWNENWWNP